jgi:methylated-DNA-[protein]-cysteine S-methyltransferase
MRRLLEDYFAGVLVSFNSVRMDARDITPFHRAAWEACRAIPPGETRTYGWLAMAAGRPGAPRAAGQAMARCRMGPIVPCHRVVAADGRTPGYSPDPETAAFQRRMERLLAQAHGNWPADEGQSKVQRKRLAQTGETNGQPR